MKQKTLISFIKEANEDTDTLKGHIRTSYSGLFFSPTNTHECSNFEFFKSPKPRHEKNCPVCFLERGKKPKEERTGSDDDEKSPVAVLPFNHAICCTWYNDMFEAEEDNKKTREEYNYLDFEGQNAMEYGSTPHIPKGVLSTWKSPEKQTRYSACIIIEYRSKYTEVEEKPTATKEERKTMLCISIKIERRVLISF